MRTFGLILIGIGVLYLAIAFNMNVAVSTSGTYIPGYGNVGGGDVANIDLISRRQNHLIVASLVTIIGVILSLFGNFDNNSEKDITEKLNPVGQKFEGERDLASDSYRLWLGRVYGIARNDVFDRFVIGEATFATLDDAIAEAHAQECAKIQEMAAREERRRISQEQRKEQWRLERETAEAEWQELKPKIYVGTVLAVLAISFLIYLNRETPESRATRLANEAEKHREMISSIEVKFDLKLPDDAYNVKLEENAASRAYLCNGSTDGTILTYMTKSSPKDVQSNLAKQLGKGIATYKVLPDKFDWEWDHNGMHYELTMFNKTAPADVHLCLTR